MVLLGVRVLVGMVAVAAIVPKWPSMFKEVGVPFTEQDMRLLAILRPIVTGIGALGVAGQLLLARGVFQGSNGAKNASMACNGLSVAGSAMAFVSSNAITLTIKLFALPLDILVFPALSSRCSRVWARKPKKTAVTGADSGAATLVEAK